MIDALIPESFRALARTRGAGLVARALVLLGPLVAIASTAAAAGNVPRNLVIAIVVLAVCSAVQPDTHLGLVVVVLLGLQWWLAVDDRATPWSMGAAAGVALFHTALAAATVAPPSARWTPVMTRRWLRRGALLLLPGIATWPVVALLDGRRPAGSGVVLAAVLLVLAIGGLWVGASSPDPT